MLKSIVIGYLGSDAEVKNSNGKEFTSFRVAHTAKFTDTQNVVHEETTWVDCIMNGSSAVNEYLKKGQLVYVEGNSSMRVYSSAKDRCMKAGLTINVRSIELLGSKTDEVPANLVRTDTGEMVKVTKFYHASTLVRSQEMPEKINLQSNSGKLFYADRSGWVFKTPENDNNTSD